MSFVFLFLFVLSKSYGESCTLEMTMTGTMGPATYDYLLQSEKKAEEKQCSSILVLINTPGGSLQSTRMIVERIVNSRIPFLCLVYPSGGHAGSAGAIILQACHVSGAMKATNIGAATPILATGQETPEDLRKKLINDTKSWLEGLTDLRQRNKEFGEKIVTEAKAVSSEEAARLGAIDGVFSEKIEFLQFSEGREVTLLDGQKSKVTVGSIFTFDSGFRFEVLQILADPQFAYMLFMGSLGLIYYELTHPGLIAPGVLGGIGLVVSMIALHKLEVWWGGVILILLGIAFIVAEAFLPSFGALGIGGIASFILGSVFLFDYEKTGHAVPLTLIVPTALFLGLIILGLTWLALGSTRIKKRGSYDDLIGLLGTIRTCNQDKPEQGQAEIRGEIWAVFADEPLVLGDEIKVIGNKGLKLKVEKSIVAAAK